MRAMHMTTVARSLLLGLCLLMALPSAAPAETAGPPDVQGISVERLRRVDEFIARLQREGKLAGAVTLIARRGQVVSLKAHGLADLESQRAMRVDDLFRLQSMTKPIATVVALQLMEEGRLRLADPVAKFLPEFADMKVAVARPEAPGGYELQPAARPMTILDLLTHRAGFVGLPPRDTPGARLRREAAKSLPPEAETTLAAYVTQLAASPLDSQPGESFSYGPATVVLGRVIEAVTGQGLDQAFGERVFKPLRMRETSFAVAESQRARIASPYALKPGQGLVRVPLDPLNPRLLSAGGNLTGTAQDYFRFAQMLLNGGTLDGVRVLSRKSVELMTAPQLDAIPLPFLAGQAFGLGVALQKAGGASGLLGSPGTYGWSGGYNTYFRIDPREQLVIVLLAQLVFTPFELELQYGFHNTAMQAIND